MSTRFERNLYRSVFGVNPPRSPRKTKSALYRGPARDERYKEWIRTLPCCACRRAAPSEAAHVGHDGGKSLKCSDYYTVPLCHACHRTGRCSYHGLNGGARAFAAMWCIDLDAEVQKYNAIYEQLHGLTIPKEALR